MSLLEMNRFSAVEGLAMIYSLVTCGALHSLHLGIFKVLKGCVVAYLLLQAVVLNAREKRGGKCLFCR